MNARIVRHAARSRHAARAKQQTNQPKPWPCSRLLTPGEAQAARLGLTAEQIAKKSGLSAGYVKSILARSCDDEITLQRIERVIGIKLNDPHPRRTIDRKQVLAGLEVKPTYIRQEDKEIEHEPNQVAPENATKRADRPDSDQPNFLISIEARSANHASPPSGIN